LFGVQGLRFAGCGLWFVVCFKLSHLASHCSMTPALRLVTSRDRCKSKRSASTSPSRAFSRPFVVGCLLSFLSYDSKLPFSCFGERYRTGFILAIADQYYLSSSRSSKPQTPNHKPQTPNPKPQTPNPKPQTPNPKPQTACSYHRDMRDQIEARVKVRCA